METFLHVLSYCMLSILLGVPFAIWGCRLDKTDKYKNSFDFLDWVIFFMLVYFLYDKLSS